MALRIIFMGTPEFSVPILESILNSNHKILNVYTQPPKKKDRGQMINISAIHKFSKKNGLNVRYPEKLNSIEEINFIKKIKPDVVVVVAYGKILPTALLDLQEIKFINVHASLLPKWRGAAPIQRSIMNLDDETGISIMKIISKLDAGPIMLKSKVKILKDNNTETLSEKLSAMGAKLILKSLDLIENDKATFIEQNEKQATYANKISKDESKINWNNKADQIIAKINALYPKPGSWINYKGTRLKINKATEVNLSGKPGEILDKKFIIGCSEKAVQVLEVQKEGKKSMKAAEFLKGNLIDVGVNVS